MKIISQIVDTLKLHYYPNDATEKDVLSYNAFLSDLKDSKALAQQLRNEDNTQRYTNVTFDTRKFRVMATSVSGFSVVLKNRDVSIAFKSMSNENNPFCKVEFRSEFLVRVGYVEAIRIVNSFMSKFVYKNPLIKVSEIHLATDMQDIDFNILDIYKFKTRARKKSIHTHDEREDYHESMHLYGRSFSGFVLGSGNYMLRVYDKTMEIQKNKNKSYIKYNKWLENPNYEEDKKVWRVEIQLRRQKLKTMLDDKRGLLDGFENVLNAIPSLWYKAVIDFDFKDLNEDQVLSIIKGYKVLKNGNEKILSRYAYTKMFQRAYTSREWESISSWNNHNSNSISRYVNIPYSSKQYLSNALKSFLSQTSKVYGDINPDTILKAFQDCEDLEQDMKSMNIIESVLLKQLDHFKKVDYQYEKNGIVGECSVLLQNNIEKYINEASSFVYFNPTRVGVDALKRKLA